MERFVKVGNYDAGHSKRNREAARSFRLTARQMCTGCATDLQNEGSFGANRSLNRIEGDRQQFEAQLNKFLDSATATLTLTNYVYALSAAVPCERQSVVAMLVLLKVPMNPR